MKQKKIFAKLWALAAPRLTVNQTFLSPGGGAGFFIPKKEVLSSLLAVLLLASPARAATISFCVDQANPMMAVDEAVAAQAVAAEHDQAAFVVRDSSKDDADNDSGNAQEKFFARLSKRCDLILGFPVEARHLNLPDGMLASVPYVRTGFVAAATGPLAPDFAAMARSGRVGVVFLTPAETYFDEKTIAAEQVFYSNDDLYGALLAGGVNEALIWQPWLVRQLAAHPAAVKTAFLAMPHTLWNIVGLYPRRGGNAASVRAFDAGIAKLRRGGKLRAAVQPYEIPGD
jgi:hypothetical protein